LTLSFTRAFRLIIDTPGDGQRNMAVDEALLLHAHEGGPSIRLYGFSPPTLSVGRLQRLRDRPGSPGMLGAEGLRLLREDGLTLVRRPTGGQAVLHDRELTYAVVLSRNQVQPFGKREIYRFIAELLLRGLEQLGVRGYFSHTRRGGLHDPNCFQATGEYEIASAAQRKLVGSAQTLTREGSLQHGAIPLDGSYRRITRYLRSQAQASERSGSMELTPGSLAEELGHPVGFAEVQQGLAAGFAAALGEQGAELRGGTLSEAEQETAEELYSRRYAQDAWNLMY
jgi:lipoate-protein ligase A